MRPVRLLILWVPLAPANNDYGGDGKRAPVRSYEHA